MGKECHTAVSVQSAEMIFRVEGLTAPTIAERDSEDREREKVRQRMFL